MKYLVVFLTVLALIGAGCASSLGNLFSETPSTQQAVVKLTVQYATLKAIKNDPARAAGVSDIVDQALAFVEGGEDPVITAKQLQGVLTQVLPDTLDAADKVLASSLITLVVQEIAARVPAPQQGIPVAEISVVLGWVKDAAALVPPAVAVPPSV